MTERIRTVERIRALAGRGDNTTEDEEDDDYCMRGLEPFQDDASHDSLHSKRNLHKSTVLMEQCRQFMFGLRDPDRFRLLLQSQSSLAQFRAVQLASIDQYEVYPDKPLSPSQRSMLLTGPPAAQSPPYSPYPRSSTSSSSLLHSSFLLGRSSSLSAPSSVLLRRRRFSMPTVSSSSSLSSLSSTGGGGGREGATAGRGNPNIPTHQQKIRPSQSCQSLSSLTDDDDTINKGKNSNVHPSTCPQAESTRTSDELNTTAAAGATASSSAPNIVSPIIESGGGSTAMKTTATSNNVIPDLSSPEMIRKFQESNARRLMEIYEPLLLGEEESGTGDTRNGLGTLSSPNRATVAHHHQNLFRFSLRRDSLSSMGPSKLQLQRRRRQQQQQQQQSLASAVMAASRFPIRRDSLSYGHQSRFSP